MHLAHYLVYINILWVQNINELKPRCTLADI